MIFKRIIKDKEIVRTAGDLDKRRTELTPHKCFICRSEDNIIDKCTKPPKDNEKQRKQVSFSERGNGESKKRMRERR